MTLKTLLYAASLLQAAAGQGSATMNADKKPSLTWTDCSSGTCKDVVSAVTVDASEFPTFLSPRHVRVKTSR